MEFRELLSHRTSPVQHQETQARHSLLRLLESKTNHLQAGEEEGWPKDVGTVTRSMKAEYVSDLEENTPQPQILYTAKLSLENKGETETFHTKGNEDFFSTQPKG